MRLFRPVAVLLVATGVLLFAVQVLRPGSAPAVASCRELASREATERCLVEAMLETGSPAGASRVLDAALLEAGPGADGLLLACHEATHEVGLRFYEATTDVASFLRDPFAGVCEWGLAHGLLAGMVTDSPTTERVSGLLVVCAAAGDPGVQQACGDSVGHALWEIERSFTTAVDRCMAAASPVGDACVSGVFMQLYRPVAPSGDDDSTWSPPLSRDEVRRLCGDLDGARAVESCAAAAHYAFAPDLQAARDRVLAAADPLAAATAGFVPVLEEALTFCQGFDGRASERCAMEVVRYALQMLRYLPAEEVETLVCDRGLALSVRTHCRNAAAAIL